MSKDPAVRRLVRRETHSSRAVPSIVAASILLVACLWLTLEFILWLLKDQPLLASPAQLFRWLMELPRTTIPLGMTGAGAGLVLVGLVLLGLALGKGRKRRRAFGSDRAAVVVDDEVLAAALSGKVRLAAGLSPGQATTTVSARSVLIRVRPTSGHPLVGEDIRAVADSELASYGLGRKVKTNVQILHEGAVGQ
ncbi:hypothetical protein J3A64_003976 [Pseudarthrobacter sp. PvP004]|uniref:hypothetical protein n=1 Tax=Pseudarthrobacter sp. PvP004 TaxID=2817850 RepID=UPI001AE7ED45|nr:hypothetical protein [Pseudarthrobacter sp. PvP004]MBP2268512.1 hypothetical protein [Pseudarthrobacter sp. PvP004]